VAEPLNRIMAKLWSVLVPGDYTSSYFPLCDGVRWMPIDLLRQRYDLSSQRVCLLGNNSHQISLQTDCLTE